MSSQSLNASINNSGYNPSSYASNPSGPVPTRDASDITRQIKERLIYNGFKNGTSVTPGTANLMPAGHAQTTPAAVNHIPGNSEWSWLPYGNQFRLSYFYGKLKCNTTCGGGLFNGNGPKLPGSTSTAVSS